MHPFTAPYAGFTALSFMALLEFVSQYTLLLSRNRCSYENSFTRIDNVGVTAAGFYVKILDEENLDTVVNPDVAISSSPLYAIREDKLNEFIDEQEIVVLL